MHIHIWHIHIWHIHIYTRICTYTHYITYTHLRIYTSTHIHAYTIYHTKWVYEIGPVPQRSHRLKLGNPKDRIYDITIHSSSDTPKRNAHFRSTLSHTFGISSGDFPENPWFGTSQKSGLGTAHVPKKWPHESSVSSYHPVISYADRGSNDPIIFVERFRCCTAGCYY
jgi:hypothetical protein